MALFIEGSKFQGVMMPRFDGKPNGPQIQSMAKCVCGAWWKDHRFGDGACPKKVDTLR
jgi:hypothetical protein